MNMKVFNVNFLYRNQISIVHGGMNSDAKAFEMRRFERGETQIMVANGNEMC